MRLGLLAAQQQHPAVQAPLLVLQVTTDRLWRQDGVDWNANRRILINYLNSGKADQE